MSSLDASLQQLMAAAQNGDKIAYSELLSKSEQWLRRYFGHKIAPAMLDDLVQETLISVHRKRASYDPKRPYLPWLAAIGRFRWIDHLRKIYRHDNVELMEELAEDPDAEDISDRLSVETLLEKLPKKQADVIRLVRLQGYSIADASDKTGQSESLVKVNIHRGIKKLGKLVAESE